MFLTLLAVTFGIAAVVSVIVARLFDRPLRQILSRLVQEDLSAAWHRYIIFAIYVVGDAAERRLDVARFLSLCVDRLRRGARSRSATGMTRDFTPSARKP